MEHFSGSTEQGGPNPHKQDEIYHRLGLSEINPPLAASHESPTVFNKATRQTYGFTTENIAEYIGKLNLPGRKVVCISGSGDFALNAFVHGAQSVDAVDISPVACLFGELKAAGLSQLSYEEFLNFFATTGRETFGSQSFSYNQYQILKPRISSEAQHFFDQLITPNGRSDFLSPNGMIIDKLHNLMDLIKKMNPYISTPEEYKTAQEALKQVTFYPQDIRDFLTQHKGHEYGFIHLSNIFAYPPYKGRDRDKEIDQTLNAANDSLAVGGEVLSYHFYHRNESKWGVDELQRRWEKKGMIGRQIIGSVPHNRDYGFSALMLQKQPPSLRARLGTILRGR